MHPLVLLLAVLCLLLVDVEVLVRDVDKPGLKFQRFDDIFFSAPHSAESWLGDANVKHGVQFHYLRGGHHMKIPQFAAASRGRVFGTISM